MDDELIEEHLDWLRRISNRKETLKHRRDNLRRLARQLTISLIEAQARDLDRWQASLAVSQSSIQTYTGHVRAFYRWLNDSGKRFDNPAKNLPMPQLPRRLPRPIPERDLKLAFKCADPEMALWLALAGWCGFRAGEISRLDDTSLIDDPDVMLLRVDGKGGKERIVPVPRAMELMIRGVVRRGPWFRTPTGLRATGNYVSRKSSDFFAVIGLPYTLHQCRHRFGTEHYRLCKDIRATQELMGHSNPSTTALYVALTQRGAQKSMDRLGKSLPTSAAATQEPRGRTRSA